MYGALAKYSKNWFHKNSTIIEWIMPLIGQKINYLYHVQNGIQINKYIFSKYFDKKPKRDVFANILTSASWRYRLIVIDLL